MNDPDVETSWRRFAVGRAEAEVRERDGRSERQGFELGARPVSNVVMARDFWF